MNKTTIEWTDATWNPIRGTKGRWHCTHVSEGCRNCYAERLNIRLGGPAYKPGVDIFRLDEKILQQPLRWKQPVKIFACDMTDLFHEDIKDEWIARVINIMASATVDCGKRHQHEEECWQGAPHIFQVLTKRPTRMREIMDRLGSLADRFIHPESPLSVHYSVTSQPLRNIWLGVSVEDQATADERIPVLLETPAAVRFVSYEPALGPVDFYNLKSSTFNALDGLDYELIDGGPQPPKLDWLIIGGESGPKARPCDLAWIRSAIQQCQAAKVPVFVKQLGRHPYVDDFLEGAFRYVEASDRGLDLPGYVLALSHKKGGDPSEWPKDLRIREYPTIKEAP